MGVSEVFSKLELKISLYRTGTRESRTRLERDSM